jgi:hypothetical protein
MRPSIASDAAFAWADKRDIHLVIHLTNALSLKTVLTEHMSNLSPWGPIASLPDDLQKAIKDAQAQRQTDGVDDFVVDPSGGLNEGEGANGGSGGGTPPPH